MFAFLPLLLIVFIVQQLQTRSQAITEVAKYLIEFVTPCHDAQVVKSYLLSKQLHLLLWMQSHKTIVPLLTSMTDKSRGQIKLACV